MPEYCCDTFKEAIEESVISEDLSFHANKKKGLFLMDMDCRVIAVDEPIKFCPYCGVKLKI